jgi:hypothetical protein
VVGVGLARQIMGKYRPCAIDELEARPSLINEPLPPENVITLRKSRPLHAMLAENLNSTKALLRRLEDGVTVLNDAQCETIRLLFVATRDQEKALNAALECDGLE